MKKRLFNLLLCISIFWVGCTYQARVYPIEGPLSEQNTGLLQSKYFYSGSGSGRIEINLPDGEVCKGEYTTLSSGSSGFGGGSAFSQNAWATYWGSSYVMPHTQRGTATLIGGKGTIIQIEYFTSSFASRGCGLGKDNKGNLYKIHF